MTQPDHVEWTWRLPPDNSVLCFAEVWMKTAACQQCLRHPHITQRIIFAHPTSDPPPPPGLSFRPPGWTSRSPGATTRCGGFKSNPPSFRRPRPISWPPNMGTGRSRSPVLRRCAEVHAYVARSDPNMGVLTGAKLSYFVDPNWERTRSAEASCKYVDGEFDKTGSLIYRHGTLNGIATAKDARRACCRWLHSCEWTQVALFVGGSCARRLRSHRSGLRAALRRVVRSRRAYAPEATGAAPCFA